MTSFKGTKIECKICSDDAIGRYFGTYLCGSCKAFFRRNASKSEKFLCPFTERCEINKMTRRHCRKCRLEKCFRAGMKKEWIHSEDKVTENIDFIDINQFKTEPKSVPSTSGPFKDGESPASDSQEEAEEGKSNITLVLSNLLDEAALHDLLEEECEEALDKECKELTEEAVSLHNTGFQCYRFGDNRWDGREDPCDFHQTHQEYLTSTTYITNCGNLVCIGAPFKSTFGENTWQWKIYQRMLGANFTAISFRSEFISRRVALNHLEAEKIDELCPFSMKLCKNSPFDFPSDIDVPGFFKILEIFLNRLIPSLSTISTFSSLCMEDRMSLIKKSFGHILLLRTSVLVDINTETLTLPKTSVTLQLSKFRDFANCPYQQYMEFIKTLKPNWRTDFKANLLCIAIILFNPETPNVFYPDNIRIHQYNYIYLLRRYLEFRSYLVCAARTDYFDLMMKIGELQETIKINEFIHDLALANRDLVGPLLGEILDIC